MASAPEVAFFALLTVAVVWDLWQRRVPNAVPLALAVVGLVVNFWLWLPGYALLLSACGLAAGALLWVPSYAFRLVGGADVKLAAAVGIWLGPFGVLRASIFAALAGGVIALIWLLKYHGLLGGWVYMRVLPSAIKVRLSGTRRAEPSGFTLPFALAIAVGASLQLAGFKLQLAGVHLF
jgi:Flp pilus assembly protein protease CpaA